MSPRGGAIVVGMSGFAGALVASMLDMGPLPKAVLVGVITGFVSSVDWSFVRPKTVQRPVSVAKPHALPDKMSRP
jgi:hypothetical protein